MSTAVASDGAMAVPEIAYTAWEYQWIHCR